MHIYNITIKDTTLKKINILHKEKKMLGIASVPATKWRKYNDAHIVTKLNMFNC